ncbi:hypothetical protein AAVH_36519 [Aphelenchoides avenae]|nr:hypothetical protein AAVH_36519 [Aphelenchus avenae]
MCSTFGQPHRHTYFSGKNLGHQWQSAANGLQLVEATARDEAATPVITALCRYFACKPRELHHKLKDPFHRWLAVQILRTKKLRTTHLEEGRNYRVRFGMLTRKNSRQLMAYGGFLRITVKQHFYARHRHYLRHANLPCVCMFGRNNSRTLVPLELLSIL